MASYQATVQTPRQREEVFAYLSDFSTTSEWDPGIAEAAKLGTGPVAVGTTFRVVSEFAGRRTELNYEVVEYDAPRRIKLRGENATVISDDLMTFAQDGEGTSVTYAAELTLKGLARLADPLLGLMFTRIGDRALAGLRSKLAPGAPLVPQPVDGAS